MAARAGGAADYDRLKCISNDDQWDTLTRGTRLIREAARNFALDPYAPIVRAIMQAVRQGSALIIVQVDNDLVLVEGTKRATAYAALGHQPFEAFVGTSSSMGNWTFGRDQSREPTGGSESGH